MAEPATPTATIGHGTVPECPGPPAAAPRVALLAHRFADDDTTGIGRYYVEVASALAALDPAPVRYELVSPAEPRPPAWLPRGVRHRPLRGHRQALLLAWCLANRPPIDDRAGSPDLVHVLHPWVPVPAKVPLVATVHDLMPILHPEWYGRRERWAYRRGACFLRDHATKVVAISDLVARQVVAHLGIERERIEVVPNGIDDAFHHAPAPSSAEVARVAERYGVEPGRYLLALGAVSTRKNLTPVFAALGRLDRLSLPPFHDLIVAGPPGLGAEQVRAEADAKGVASRVHFAGFVPDDDLPALLGGSLALVHPSLDEGFGLTPLEAMAAGTVAIASTSGALPEVMGDAGLLVDPHDGDAWAAAISTVRNGHDRRAAWIAAGQERATRYSWRANARQLQRLHLRVLADRGTSPEGDLG